MALQDQQVKTPLFDFAKTQNLYHFDIDQPDDDDVNRTIMFMNSTSESFNQWYTSSQRDLAPTVLDFMGIESVEFECKTDGVSVIAD